jgi:hypothetical protein
MPYGTIKVDTITFTNGGVDKSISISGLAQNPTFTGNVTATGTISGDIIQGGTTVSGLTVTGTTANFVSGVFTTQISGAIVKVPAGTAAIPSLQVGTGASVSPGLYGAGTDLLGISTGGASAVIIDSVGQLRVVNIGSAAAPAFVVGNDLNTGIYSSGADQLAISTNGTERLRIASTGAFGLSGANYGTSGQVLTSNGSGSTPTWTTISAGGDVFLSANNAFTGANTFYNSTGQTFGTATSTQDGIILAGRAGGTTSLRVTIRPDALTASRTLTLPDASGTVLLGASNNAFTGANTFYNGTGQTFGTATSTQDGIILAGRAGGTTSLRVTIQPGTLTTSRTLTLPDVTGTVVTTGDTGTVTSNMIATGAIADTDINASAAIAYSKLANMTAGSILLGNASNVPTVTAMSGDVTITSGGVTSIGTGVIVNADVNASAAIAGTKISPDFGSQNIITTGSVQGSLKAESAISTVSVSTATFSSIPSWVKRIHLLFSDVSTTGADSFGIRVGTSGGIVSTGYLGANFRVSDGGTPSVAAFSTEFTIVFAGSSGAASIYSGSLTLSNITGNTWVIGGTFAANATGTNNRTGCLNGYIALAGALTQVQLVDITAGFDAGSFNILYEG